MATLHKNMNFTYLLAIIMAFFAFLFNIIAFTTPYWLISWPRLYSPFTRIGMWEVCLNGFIHPWDYTMKAYVGCWWILSSEFMEIRFWLLPAWFVFCQILMILCVIMDLLSLIFMIAVLLFRIEKHDTNIYKGKLGRYGPKLMKTSIAFGFLNTIFFFVVAVLLAIYSEDPTWMPNPVINKFSWSYGLGILSGFASTFASLALLYELRSMMRAAPDATDMPMAPSIEEIKSNESTI